MLLVGVGVGVGVGKMTMVMVLRRLPNASTIAFSFIGKVVGVPYFQHISPFWNAQALQDLFRRSAWLVWSAGREECVVRWVYLSRAS